MTAPRTVTVGLVVGRDTHVLHHGAPSALAQRLPGEVRLVVVAESPGPQVAAALERLAGDARVEVIHEPRPRGPATARNRILAEAGDGPVAWMDAATVWQPRHLASQLRALGNDGAHRDRVAVASATGAGRRADLAGDQLRALLAGELAPPLATVLAPARLLRAAGGFDERLGPEHERELLLRLVAHGARLVATPGPGPTCTRLAVPDGPAAATLARDLRVIRDAHRPRYARYGRRFARTCHERDLRAVAALHAGEGHGLRAAGTRAAAGLLALLDRLVRRRLAGRVVRAGRRLRAGTAATARRPPPDAEDGGGDAPTGGPGTEDAATLERRLGEAGTVAPDTWLRLEAAHRAADDLPAAQRALERGLAHHPHDGALRARLVELLVLRRDWRGCTAAWEALDADGRQSCTAVTYTRAASAYRMLEDHARALRVAEAGARRWPRSHEVQRELYRARAALVDWERCLHAPPAAVGAGTDEAPVGTVTGLGFLAGGSGGVTGRVQPPTDEPAAVSLLVNEEPVVTTYARPTEADGATARFSLDAHDLVEFLGDGDVLSVRSEGRPVEIEGVGPRCVVLTGYPSRAPVLRKRLASGWVFAKHGRLRRRPTAEDKRDTVAFLRTLSAVVEHHTGQVTYPLYGTLLGTIREHDLVSHDVGGFDLGYVSAHERPEAVRAEFLALCRGLLAHGYHLTVTPWCAMVRRRSTDAGFLDLNFAWFTAAGALQLSYGWRYPPATGPARIRAPRTCPLAGHLVPVPGAAEAVLEQIYGPGWTVPDQGFDPEVELQRDARFLLGTAELETLRDEHPERVRIESAPEPGGGAAADETGT